MRNAQGQPFQGIIQSLTLDKVVVDFNHPMAGKYLHFSGHIVSVREASADEIAHGHVHE